MALIDNLVSYYKLDENAANTTVADAHGSNTGTASTNTENLYYSSGVINSAFDFDGSSEYVDIDTPTFAYDGNFSVSFWFNTRTWVSTDRAISFKSDINFHFQEGSTAGTWVLSYGGDGNNFNVATGLSNNQWYHAVITFDGTTSKFYLDNVLKDTRVPTVTSDARSNSIGRESASTRYYHGRVDEVAVWDKVLTGVDGEVTELYNSGDGLAYPFAAPEVAVELSFQTDGLNYVVQPI